MKIQKIFLLSLIILTGAQINGAEYNPQKSEGHQSLDGYINNKENVLNSLIEQLNELDKTKVFDLYADENFVNTQNDINIQRKLAKQDYYRDTAKDEIEKLYVKLIEMVKNQIAKNLPRGLPLTPEEQKSLGSGRALPTPPTPQEQPPKIDRRTKRPVTTQQPGRGPLPATPQAQPPKISRATKPLYRPQISTQIPTVIKIPVLKQGADLDCGFHALKNSYWFLTWLRGNMYTSERDTNLQRNDPAIFPLSRWRRMIWEHFKSADNLNADEISWLASQINIPAQDISVLTSITQIEQHPANATQKERSNIARFIEKLRAGHDTYHAFIIGTMQDRLGKEQITGHWFTVIVEQKNGKRFLYLMDSLGSNVSRRPQIQSLLNILKMDPNRLRYSSYDQLIQEAQKNISFGLYKESLEYIDRIYSELNQSNMLSEKYFLDTIAPQMLNLLDIIHSIPEYKRQAENLTKQLLNNPSRFSHLLAHIPDWYYDLTPSSTRSQTTQPSFPYSTTTTTALTQRRLPSLPGKPTLMPRRREIEQRRQYPSQYFQTTTPQTKLTVSEMASIKGDAKKLHQQYFDEREAALNEAKVKGINYKGHTDWNKINEDWMLNVMPLSSFTPIYTGDYQKKVDKASDAHHKLISFLKDPALQTTHTKTEQETVQGPQDMQTLKVLAKKAMDSFRESIARAEIQLSKRLINFRTQEHDSLNKAWRDALVAFSFWNPKKDTRELWEKLYDEAEQATNVLHKYMMRKFSSSRN